MAMPDVMTFTLSADTKTAWRVARLLMPLVWLRLLSVDRATSITMRFVKVSVAPVAK